jgi:hypothetical protein
MLKEKNVTRGKEGYYIIIRGQFIRKVIKIVVQA